MHEYRLKESRSQPTKKLRSLRVRTNSVCIMFVVDLNKFRGTRVRSTHEKYYRIGEFVGYSASANILMEYVLSDVAITRSFTEYPCTTFGQEDPNACRVELDGLMEGYMDPTVFLFL